MSTTRTGFKHILVPTDFNEPANRALDVALLLAEKFDARVTLLHVYHVPWPIYDVAVILPTEELAATAQRALDSTVAKAKARYARCEAALRTGSPAERIVETADELAADAIVMGTHGRRGLMHAFLGSVAEQVVRTSPVPVVTVVGDEHATAPETRAVTVA